MLNLKMLTVPLLAFGMLLGAAVATPAVAQNCTREVSTVQELIDAINAANAGAECSDHITVKADLQVSAGYEGGDTAFPTIRKRVTISMLNRKIERVAGSPPFRFFHVDGRKGGAGSLKLIGGTLQGGGGEELTGGAVLVDQSGASPFSGRALAANAVTFRGNTGLFGGAVFVNGASEGKSSVEFVDSNFEDNRANFGGGVFVSSFMRGSSVTGFTNPRFVGNEGSLNGAALYVDAVHFGKAWLIFNDGTFLENRSDKAAILDIDARSNADVRIVRWYFSLDDNAPAGVDFSFDARDRGSVDHMEPFQMRGSPGDRFACFTGDEMTEIPCP